MQNIPEILGVIIVMAPLVIFILTMLVIKNRMKDQSINLADMLVETDVPLPENDKKDGDATTPKAPVKRSASRLILFLSGVTSLILSVCITTYYFYMKIYCINCGTGLDLDDFTNVILALGIGFVPYSINQVKKIRL
jgi:flagellar basal body-associated protein FliL